MMMQTKFEINIGHFNIYCVKNDLKIKLSNSCGHHFYHNQQFHHKKQNKQKKTLLFFQLAQFTRWQQKRALDDICDVKKT